MKKKFWGIPAVLGISFVLVAGSSSNAAQQAKQTPAPEFASAEQGYVEAQRSLGAMYAAGRGVPQDHAEAINWWRKAAEQGFPEAIKNLNIFDNRK